MSQFPNLNPGQNLPQGLQARIGSPSPMPLSSPMMTSVPAFNATPHQPMSNAHAQSLAELHQRQQSMLMQQQLRQPPVSLQQLQGQLARMSPADRESFLAQAARLRPGIPGTAVSPQLQQAALQHQQQQQQARAIQSFMVATNVAQPQPQQPLQPTPNSAPQLIIPPSRSRTPQPSSAVQSPLPTTPQLGTRPLSGATPPQLVQALPSPQPQATYHPSLLTTPPQASSSPARMPSPPRPPSTARRPSIPISQAFTPSTQTVQAPARPETPVESSLKRKTPPESLYSQPQKKPTNRPVNTAPQFYFANTGSKARESSPVIDLSNERDVGDRRPSEPQALGAEVRRKRDERMRRSMRDDIARLMYACGDVHEPDVDTVDYVEDLVVDFLADLCRPSPLIRSNPQSTYQPHPLTAPILRHRLSSTPALRKYLDRFDELSAKSIEIAAQRRMMRGTENPNDLVNIVGKDYLEVDEEGKEVGMAGEGKRKRGRPRTKGVGENDVRGVARGRKKGTVVVKKVKPPI